YIAANPEDVARAQNRRANADFMDVPDIKGGDNMLLLRKQAEAAYEQFWGWRMQKGEVLQLAGFMSGLAGLYMRLADHARNGANTQFPGAGRAIQHQWEAIAATYFQAAQRASTMSEGFHAMHRTDIERHANPRVNEHLANAGRNRTHTN